MSWRTVVITHRAKLELKLNYMVVRSDEVNRVYLSEIGTLIIESTAVSLTSSLLCELIKRKIKVIFCDEKRNPISELSPYYGSHDTSNKVKNQLNWETHSKRLVWTEIVSEKIRNQSNLLKELGKSSEAKLLNEYVSQIALGDETNREGHAAKVYFNAIFGMEFTRSSENSINAALNYGYSILLSAFNREICAKGYLTQIGLFHDNMFNQFNLSSDFMEPFRILVDRQVFSHRNEEFDRHVKMALVNVLNEQVVIDGKTHYVNNAITLYCKSILEALNQSDISLIRFYKYEL